MALDSYAGSQGSGGHTPDDAEREDKLLRMLKAEEEDALGYRQTDLQQQQITALNEYFGKKYGDEEEGRSQVVSRETLESIERIRPDLLRVFAGGGDVVFLEETSEDDAEYAKAAADYLNWVFMVDNPGYRLINDFAFDALLQRRGFIAAYWREAEYRAPQTLTGLGIEQMLELHADPNIQIIGQDFDEADAEAGITLQIKRQKTPARIEIVTVAPEDMRLNGRAVEMDDARYVGRVLRMLRGEVAEMWPKKAQEIQNYSGDAQIGPQSTLRGSEVRTARFQDGRDWSPGNGNTAAQEIEVLEEYLRTDLNDDGYPELIRCYRMGDLMLDCEEVEENPFGSWTPIPVAHRFYGLSVQDLTTDLQRIATVLKRAALDATYQSVVNREFYDESKITDTTALSSNYAGTKIPVKGDPATAVYQATGDQDTAQTAWEALDRLQVAVEERTGSVRSANGVDPDALLTGAHSGKAIDLLQTAAAARKEMMARNMGSGLSDFFSKLHRLACRHQDKPTQLKVGGKWCQFKADPDKDHLRVHIHTGLGTGNRDQTVMGVMAIANFQQQIVERIGPQNPMVTPKHIHRTFEELVRALGWRSADGFMSEPPDVPVTDPKTGQPQIDPQTGQPATQPWTPPPPADPNAAKAQADLQIAAQDAQLKREEMQQANQHVVLQSQKDMALAQQEQQDNLQQNQLQAQVDTQRLENERAKNEADAALAERELDLKAAELAFEAHKLEVETQLEEKRIAHEGEKMAHEDKHKNADRKLSMTPEQADASDGKPSVADHMAELVAHMKKPVKIKRDKKTGEMTIQ